VMDVVIRCCFAEAVFCPMDFLMGSPINIIQYLQCFCQNLLLTCE
jgi:hypothetical protein